MRGEIAKLRLLPRPACGERVGVRGTLQGFCSWRSPSPARKMLATSPRKRGEVRRNQFNTRLLSGLSSEKVGTSISNFSPLSLTI
jgi:hypothetical protein